MMDDYFAEFIWKQRFQNLQILLFLASNYYGFITCLILLDVESVLNWKSLLLMLILWIENLIVLGIQFKCHYVNFNVQEVNILCFKVGGGTKL